MWDWVRHRGSLTEHLHGAFQAQAHASNDWDNEAISSEPGLMYSGTSALPMLTSVARVENAFHRTDHNKVQQDIQQHQQQ